MSCGIYMWVSPSNKVYIGQSRDLEKRKKTFTKVSAVYTSAGSAIDNARKKYSDFSKWKYLVLELCEEQELNEKEKFYIEKYNSFEDGYNSNDGFDFVAESVVLAGKKRAKSVLQYGLDGEFIKKWDTAKNAADELNLSYSSLSDAASIKKKLKTCGGFQWRWYSGNGDFPLSIKPIKNKTDRISEAKFKPVVQYGVDGSFIKEWKSIKEASEIIGINHTHISACCKGKRPTAGGFQWSYKSTEKTRLNNIGDSKTRISAARKKRVLQYSLNGDFIKKWESITLAENTLKINGVSQCVSGKILTAGGFQWREDNGFIEEKITKVLPRRKRASITRTGKKNRKTENHKKQKR